jgi:hypothetical protein
MSGDHNMHCSANAPKWEAYLNPLYFNMWCVRPRGEFVLGKTFYVQSQAVADDLARELNAVPRPAE